MMQEEFAGDGEARGEEHNVISTSLRAIQDPHAESARELLKAFRLVPEDVKCPWAALQYVHTASADEVRESRH
eukprot:SAG31_NODE_7_length_42755_cov_130.245728_23_plen_73_part_00